MTTSPVLWYLTRATGLVELVLLTLTVALGISQVVRWAPAGWPRFVVAGLHRNVAILATVVLGLHVGTTLLDTYVHVSPLAVVVPFVGSYHPLALGLGAAALDAIVVLVASSLLRERIGHHAWRAIHWCAYLSWPVAAIHGLTMGTDRTAHWVLGLDAACALVLALAVGWRLLAAPPAGPAEPALPPEHARREPARTW